MFDAFVKICSREEAGNWIGEVGDKVEGSGHKLEPVSSFLEYQVKVSV